MITILAVYGVFVIGEAVQTVADMPSFAESIRGFRATCRGVAENPRTWGPLGDPETCRLGWSRNAQQLGYYASKDPSKRREALDLLLAGVKQMRVTERREAAIQGLIVMDPPPSEAIPLLIEATSSRKGNVPDLAATALIEYGPSLVPVLRQAYFRDGVIGAARVLSGLGDPGLPVLLEIMEKDAINRVSVARLLRPYGPRAAPALPWLVSLLEHSFSGVRGIALDAIGELGASGAPSVPKIVEVMKMSEPSDAARCAKTLGKIGPAAAAALPELRKLVGRPGYNAIAINQAIKAIEGSGT